MLERQAGVSGHPMTMTQWNAELGFWRANLEKNLLRRFGKLRRMFRFFQGFVPVVAIVS